MYSRSGYASEVAICRYPVFLCSCVCAQPPPPTPGFNAFTRAAPAASEPPASGQQELLLLLFLMLLQLRLHVVGLRCSGLRRALDGVCRFFCVSVAAFAAAAPVTAFAVCAAQGGALALCAAAGESNAQTLAVAGSMQRPSGNVLPQQQNEQQQQQQEEQQTRPVVRLVVLARCVTCCCCRHFAV